MDLMNQFNDAYKSFRMDDMDDKYFPFLSLKKYVNQNFSDKKLVGKSFLGNDIYKISLGNGSKKILVWSQMHGNESTGTRAMFDVFSFFKQNKPLLEDILSQLTIDFIPMLNPDGSTLYTRRNAAGIDINRDFLQEASPEIKILKQVVSNNNYHLLLNLHDQRTIFNVSGTNEPATLSFLAPSADLEETITKERKIAMSIIHAINKDLQTFIPNKIGRYSSEFYPTATGDNFMAMGLPTILFEAGHYPNDYKRNKTRKYNALALLSAFKNFAFTSNYTNYKEYFTIPENAKQFLDIIIRNVKIEYQNNQSIIDLGILFEEIYNAEKKNIQLVAKIIEIGDLSNYFGHLELDAKGSKFINDTNNFPKINSLANFTVGTIQFNNGAYIN